MHNSTPACRSAALAVLGLPEDATAPQVTRAYRRLARETHPDVTGRGDAEGGRRFAAVSAAYRLLADPPAQAPAWDGASTPPGFAGAPLARRLRQAPAADRAARPPIVAGPVFITPSAPDGPSAPTRRP